MDLDVYADGVGLIVNGLRASSMRTSRVTCPQLRSVATESDP